MNTTSTRSRGLLALLLALAMVLGFSACGSTSGSSSNSSGSSTASNDSGNNTGTSGDTPTVTKGSNGKALIAYFSKTGTTQRAAEEIQKLTGADMFRIEPVQAYPEEYQRTTEIARDELNQNARTQVKGKVDDMAQYDTIFVGYPIWWMEPPMPVLTFLESYDLNGKTVIPSPRPQAAASTARSTCFGRAPRAPTSPRACASRRTTRFSPGCRRSACSSSLPFPYANRRICP